MPFSRVHITIAIVNSQELWLSAEGSHKNGPVSSWSWREVELMEIKTLLLGYWQLIESGR